MISFDFLCHKHIKDWFSLYTVFPPCCLKLWNTGLCNLFRLKIISYMFTLSSNIDLLWVISLTMMDFLCHFHFADTNALLHKIRLMYKFNYNLFSRLSLPQFFDDTYHYCCSLSLITSTVKNPFIPTLVALSYVMKCSHSLSQWAPNPHSLSLFLCYCRV